ncbi:Phenylalanine--tRNA ligase beta subunit [uncultured archaeon]|nr:Phenylalanine--tRNA ligase beta subunit [uncultured archaeon]
MSDELVRSLMQLQEKLHDTLGRKRRKVAIGVHDLDQVVFPIKFAAVPRESVRFVPLDFETELSCGDILREHPKGRDFAHLVPDLCPLITDAENHVLSFPPIINGERTRVTPKTTNLLLDVTGTSESAVSFALNIVACALADRGGEIVSVKVGNELFPKLTPPVLPLPLKEANKLLGANFSQAEAEEFLTRLGYECRNGKVFVPPYRTDVLHAVDLIEDMAIAHGYNEFSPTLPNLSTVGRKQRDSPAHEVLTGLEFNETMTWSLSNPELLAKAGFSDENAVKIINPLTTEYTLVRPALLPGLLQVLKESRSEKMPQKVYELGDVAHPNPARRLALAVTHARISFSEAKSVLDALSRELNLRLELKPADHPAFIPGRCAAVHLGKIAIGFIGEVHPRVLNNYGLEQPVAALEIEI